MMAKGATHDAFRWYPVAQASDTVEALLAAPAVVVGRRVSKCFDGVAYGAPVFCLQSHALQIPAEMLTWVSVAPLPIGGRVAAFRRIQHKKMHGGAVPRGRVLWRIKYDDGDQEEQDATELVKHLTERAYHIP